MPLPLATLLVAAAGSPLFFKVPKLTGYDVEIGRNFGGKFNYTCPRTFFNASCVLTGTAQARWLLISLALLALLGACCAELLCWGCTSQPCAAGLHGRSSGVPAAVPAAIDGASACWPRLTPS